MAWDGVLVRFGEIGIKSAPVRRQMMERLRQNLEDGVVRAGLEAAVQRMGPRVWMVGPDPEALLQVARRTFGVVSVSLARHIQPEMDALCAAAAEEAVAVPGWTSFAIRSRRDGSHAFSSQEVAQTSGSAVWKAMEAAGREVRVDLSNPELEIHLDVRQHHAYLFLHQVAGPGGLPVGTQGTVAVLLSDAHSALAAWLMMRRGCKVVAIHAGDSGSLPIAWTEHLILWGMNPEIELLPVCSGSTTKATLQAAAASIARDIGADVIVTGERTHAQFAPCDLPILRPLAGMDEATVLRLNARMELPDDEPVEILDETSDETLESLLSMRRIVRV